MSYPVFTGGARKLERERAQVQVLQARTQQADVRNQLETRLRADLANSVAAYRNVSEATQAARSTTANYANVLVDRIEIEEKAGKTEFRAIVDAAKQRFRPIPLTTFTTTLGLIPLYLGGGLMWEPMAVLIMVGLLFSTVITLVFVPVLYKLLFGIKEQERGGTAEVAPTAQPIRPALGRGPSNPALIPA